MRIIAGAAKGMLLAVPRTGVRPTADRIREAIFSSLGERVVGADVLDLFAGTGALGFEAASRGARSVVFVENSRAALPVLKRNMETFRTNREIHCELTVARADVLAKIRKLTGNAKRFSLVLADPPYGEAAQSLLADKNLPLVLAGDGLVVLESARRTELSIPAVWKVVRESVYGDTRVTFLAPES